MKIKHTIINIITIILLFVIFIFILSMIQFNYFTFILIPVFIGSLTLLPYIFLSERKDQKKYLFINLLVISGVIILILGSIITLLNYQMRRFAEPAEGLQSSEQIVSMFMSPTFFQYLLLFICFNIPNLIYFLVTKNKVEQVNEEPNLNLYKQN